MMYGANSSSKPTDCQATMVVEAAIEACLDMWLERVALGRDGREEAEEVGEVEQADEVEDVNGGKYHII